MSSTKFFFFVEEDLIQEQSETLAYGPVLNEKTTKYRVTSLFKTNVPAKAFAVCDGLAIIQESTDNSDFVNLIIKPLKTIENSFTPVEYYIYRGLKKENFIQSDQIIAKDSPNKTDLIESIWDDFNDLKEKHPNDFTAAAPNVGVLGWNLNSEDGNTPLENIFSQIRTEYEFAQVKAGDFIGYFSTTDTFNAGFEIVLQERADTITLEKLRLPENIISVAAPAPTDIKGNEPIAIMREREKILSYVDPAAYLMLCNECGVIYMDSSANKQTVFGYNDIFTNLVSSFFTKNSVYIDIRNENGYSFNYYKDYEGKTTDVTKGKHLTVSYDNGATEELTEYYTEFWPIFTFKKTGVSAEILPVKLSIRLDYNPQPYIFYDYALKKQDNKLTNITGNEKFVELQPKLLPDEISSGWTLPFTVNIPVISDTAASISKIYIGRNNYDDIQDAPDTLLKREHYLDFIISPVSSISETALTSGSQWRSVLGKKLLSAKYALGYNAAVEITLVETATLIQFYVQATDAITLSATLNPYETNIVSNNTYPVLGKSMTSSETEYRDNTNIELNETYIENKDIYLYNIMPVMDTDGSYYKPKVCCLTFTRDEYDNYIKNAITEIDETLHEVSLGIANASDTPPETQSCLTQLTDANGTYYYEGTLKLHGLNSAGIRTIESPIESIEINTTDSSYFSSTTINFNTQAPPHTLVKNNALKKANKATGTDFKAYFTFREAIRYIEVVEKCYSTKDKNIGETCTRIRVHYYGGFAKKSFPFIEDIFKQEAFENLILDAPYDGLYRFLYRDIMKEKDKKDGADVYDHLTAQANENEIQDNSSPYLIVLHGDDTRNTYHADFGQILYGFESLKLTNMGGGYYGYNEYSLYNNKAYKNKLPFKYSAAYTFKPTELISYDYSGLIANIATPIAECFYHLKKNVPPYSGSRVPNYADLSRYYEISAPNADLFGNADALGIYCAYENLKHNTGLLLSDVFTLYYYGKSSLRQGLIIKPVRTYYKYDKRWANLATEFKILSGTTWLPDSPFLSLEWSDIRASILNKMWLFAEFWYNKLLHKKWTGFRVAENIPFPIHRFISVDNQSSISDPSFNETDYNQSKDYQVLKDYVEYCFENRFLLFLKTKCQEEGSLR